jgi:hypothetical protein
MAATFAREGDSGVVRAAVVCRLTGISMKCAARIATGAMAGDLLSERLPEGGTGIRHDVEDRA